MYMGYPMVSVIIPTYNTGKYICDAIKSVLEQSYKNYEIIVIDDGSTDNTRENLKPYMNKIIYIYQENMGRGAARNRGIKYSKGEYIAFLDSDDLWTPTKLEKQIKILKNNIDIDFHIGDGQRIREDGTIRINSYFDYNGYNSYFFGDPLFINEPYKKLLKTNYILTPVVMLKKMCFERSGVFDESIYNEDWELWLRIAIKNRFAYSSEKYAIIRDRSGSAVKDLDALYLSNLSILERQRNLEINNSILMRIYLNTIIRETYKEKGLFFFRKNILIARKCFKESLKINIRAKTFILFIATFLPELFRKVIQDIKIYLIK